MKLNPCVVPGELLLRQRKRCLFLQVRQYPDHHQNRHHLSLYGIQCHQESALCGKLHRVHLLQCQQHLPDLRQAVFSPGGNAAGLLQDQCPESRSHCFGENHGGRPEFIRLAFRRVFQRRLHHFGIRPSHDGQQR